MKPHKNMPETIINSKKIKNAPVVNQHVGFNYGKKIKDMKGLLKFIPESLNCKF